MRNSALPSAKFLSATAAGSPRYIAVEFQKNPKLDLQTSVHCETNFIKARGLNLAGRNFQLIALSHF